MSRLASRLRSRSGIDPVRDPSWRHTVDTVTRAQRPPSPRTRAFRAPARRLRHTGPPGHAFDLVPAERLPHVRRSHAECPSSRPNPVAHLGPCLIADCCGSSPVCRLTTVSRSGRPACGVCGGHRDDRGGDHVDRRRWASRLDLHDRRGGALIEELQFTLGEGPWWTSPGAMSGRRTRPRPSRRQPMGFVHAAGAGVRGASGVRVPGFGRHVKVGALNLYRDRPGPLSDDQRADAVLVARIAARAIIDMQADAAPGVLGAGLEVGTNSRSSCTKPPGWSPCNSASVSPRPCRASAPRLQHRSAGRRRGADVVGLRLRFDPSDGEPVN